MEEIISAIKEYAMNNTLLAIAKADENTLKKHLEQAEKLERIKKLVYMSQQEAVIAALKEALGEHAK